MSASVQTDNRAGREDSGSHEGVSAAFEYRVSARGDHLPANRAGELDVADDIFGGAVQEVARKQDRNVVCTHMGAGLIDEGDAIAVAVPGDSDRTLHRNSITFF